MSAVQQLLEGFPVIIELPVVWGEMDAYVHVNNVVYFRYFESSRVAYITRVGWIEYERQTGIGSILAAIEGRFRRALTFPDTISVGARVIALEEDRFTLEHRIVSHQQQTFTTEGKGTVVSYHYPSQKKTPIPEEIRRRIVDLEGWK